MQILFRFCRVVPAFHWSTRRKNRYTASSSILRRWPKYQLSKKIENKNVKQEMVERFLYVFADVVLVVGIAVQFTLLLSSHAVRLCQSVLQFFQLTVQAQDFCLFFTTLSLNTVSFHRQSAQHTHRGYYHFPTHLSLGITEVNC